MLLQPCFMIFLCLHGYRLKASNAELEQFTFTLKVFVLPQVGEDSTPQTMDVAGEYLL